MCEWMVVCLKHTFCIINSIASRVGGAEGSESLGTENLCQYFEPKHIEGPMRSYKQVNEVWWEKNIRRSQDSHWLWEELEIVENRELPPGLEGSPLDAPWFVGYRGIRSSEFLRQARNLGIYVYDIFCEQMYNS